MSLHTDLVELHRLPEWQAFHRALGRSSLCTRCDVIGETSYYYTGADYWQRLSVGYGETIVDQHVDGLRDLDNPWGVRMTLGARLALLDLVLA